MTAPAPKAELMRSLGLLVRGLAALFWGLPLATLVCAHNVVSDWVLSFGIAGPLLLTAVLYHGVRQLAYFQPQERIWMQAVERAKILALVNFGLSPFIYWWNRVPEEPFFAAATGLFFVTALLFVHNLNLALERLTAMLPDETLRVDTRLFTRLNRGLLLAVMLFMGVLYALLRIHSLPDPVLGVLNDLYNVRHWLITALLVPPLAMTMTLIWKIKEVIFASAFDRSE